MVEFQQTDVDVENLVLGYQSLALPEPAPEQSQTDSDEHAEIERLKAENERLSEELRVTMDTMGRMLNEYSSMFAGGAENDVDKGQLMKLLVNTEPDAEPVLADKDEVEAQSVNEADSSASDVNAEKPPEEDAVLADLDKAVADESKAETQDEFPSDGLADEVRLMDAEESMMDNLAGVDIEIPDAGTSEDIAQVEPESLEDEWSKLLAEEAESTDTETAEGGIDGKTQRDGG